MSINEKDGYIFTASGEPFADEQAAKMRAGVLKRDGIIAAPVEYEGGWVLKREEAPNERRRYKFWEEANPLLVNKNKLDPKFEYRIINDDENVWRNRVDTMHRAGWEFCEDIDMNDQVAGMANQRGGRASIPVGKGVRGFLMRKPKEWYKEDYAEKQKVNDEVMKQIKAIPNEVPGGAKPMNDERIGYSEEVITG